MADVQEKKGGKPISRAKAYNKAAAYFVEAFETILDEMRNGDNSNARVGAAKLIINKVLPDLKAQEITGKDGEKLPFTVIINDASETK